MEFFVSSGRAILGAEVDGSERTHYTFDGVVFISVTVLLPDMDEEVEAVPEAEKVVVCEGLLVGLIVWLADMEYVDVIVALGVASRLQTCGRGLAAGGTNRHRLGGLHTRGRGVTAGGGHGLGKTL
eukprot:gene20532-biopygen921